MIIDGVYNMILENEKLSIECLENYGGKISSIYDKEKQIEFLFQNPYESYKEANLGDDFSLFEACGFDDTYPSIDEGKVNVNDKEILYPDHGEIWSAKFNYIIVDNKVNLSYESKILPYKYEKSLSLRDNGFIINYKITNIGDYEFPAFYTFHCLVDSKEGIKLITDKSLNKAKIVFSSNRFKNNQIVEYPISNNFDLSSPESLDNKNCEKFYFIDKCTKGIIGYNYTKDNVKLLISYDETKLPYLGFWNTQGGFRDDYNFALEMTNGYYDSIEIAQNNNACPTLKPNEILEFDIEFKIEHY